MIKIYINVWPKIKKIVAAERKIASIEHFKIQSMWTKKVVTSVKMVLELRTWP